MKPGFVYIMASRLNGTLYTGVTSNLVQRAHQHRTGALSGFTARTDALYSSGSKPTTTSRSLGPGNCRSSAGKGTGSCA